MSTYLEPFAVYCKFNALKLHFTSMKYNYLKHHGAVKASYDTFIKRKDVSIFNTMAKTIPDNTIVPFFISQFIGRNFLTSVTDIVKNPAQSKKLWYDWLDRVNDVRVLYKKDIIALAKMSNGGTWKSLLSFNGDDYPQIFKLVCSNEISPETYSCLYDIFTHEKQECEDVSNDTMFLSLNLKYTKYRCFINVSRKDILGMTPDSLADVL